MINNNFINRCVYYSGFQSIGFFHLLTILVNTDYVVTNAAISSNYYSHQLNPIGYPHWFNCVAFIVTGIDNGAGGQPTFSDHRAMINGSSYKAHICITNCYKDGTTWYFNWTSPIATANSTVRTIVGIVAISWGGNDHSGTVQTVTGATGFYAVSDSSAPILDNTLLAFVDINMDFEF